MPLPPTVPPPTRAFALPRLMVLTALVLLVHALLLGGMPSAAGLLARAPDAATPPDTVATFETRTLAPEPMPEPLPVRKTAARLSPPKTTPASVATTQPALATPTPTPTPAPVAAAPAADTVTVAAAAPVDAQTHSAASSPGAPAKNGVEATHHAATDTPPPTAHVAATETTHTTPVAYPDSIRLLYDGKGEEKSFIKYAASGELLWLHDAAQYSARLEISAWGFRVRTWTSKGELTDAGLAPIRFGDKPRGAELATHFQRDKNIISFSANNPDVPLQQGAQDKLSALLQLSALVAGAPERYSAGNSIRFQAADAHNAEVWNFKVGALELLDLPGGPKQALKLSKAPTLEFDQGIEVWLAPDLHYLPVRLRITEANGAFADLLWRKTQNSD